MAAAPNLVGARLGGYNVEALIGSGGMASVYRAFDPNLQRSVAIKVLSPATASQPDFVERFRQEARLIASLRHPNIVHVYDFGEQDGRIYMVQELLPGPTLEQRLADAIAQGRQLAWDEILAIATQLAGALDAAHAAGIIHRDVKPSNALWNAHGALVLTDFGIAKNTLTTANYTQAGFVLGTPTYLSPEQAQGLALTPASDIYALGVVLYELITGTAPFASPNAMRVVMSHVHDPPPPLRPLRPDLPAVVDTVVQRALAKDPARRFGSAVEFARALADAWPAMPTPAAGSGQPTIHQQATQHWSSPRVAGGAPLISGHSSSPVRGPVAPTAPSPIAARGRTQPLLLVVGALLGLLLLAGVVLASRGNGQGGDDRVGAGAAAPAPMITPDTLSSAPAGQPTSLSEATAAPAIPTAVETPDKALADARALMLAGIADGRMGANGEALLAHLDAA